MNEQEKANTLSTQIDQLLQKSAPLLVDDLTDSEDRSLLDVARMLATQDFSAQSDFLRHMQQPYGVKKMLFVRNGRRALVALGAAALLLIMAVTLIAPVRTFAQDLWQGLFVRHESSRMATEPHEVSTDPTPAPIPAPESVPNLSLAEADALASFAVKGLTNLPAGYALSSVYYDEARDKVTFLYLNDAYLGIVLHQEPAEMAEAWTIGADAVIEAVTVNGIAAEYVRGSWQWAEPEVSGAMSTEMVWDDADPHQQLRWTSGGIVYTLSTTVGQELGLTQADLIALAESLR